MQQEYNPIGCEHKLPNGLSAWQFQSESKGSGPEFDFRVTIFVCSGCGDIKLSGYRWDGIHDYSDQFDEVFDLLHASAIDAIIKAANFFNEEIKWGRVSTGARSAGTWVKASDDSKPPDSESFFGKIKLFGEPEIKKALIRSVPGTNYYTAYGVGVRTDFHIDRIVEWLDEAALPDNKDREQAIGLLKTLCGLKQYKDAKGKDEYYEQQKELAWKEAFDFLKQIRQ